MSTQTIDAAMLSKLFLAGAANLEAKKEMINELNVFPVPDGDTGSNMTMTILSAVRAVNDVVPAQMEGICRAISSGSLRGARGNSGVILSQLLRGFTKVIRDEEQIDVSLLARAFVNAKETAYKAVMKPKEGTILTVARVMAEKAEEIADSAEDIETFGDAVITAGLEALSMTPELLPVLKEAGVVDSGGQGLMEVVIGAYDYLTGKTTTIDINTEKAPSAIPASGDIANISAEEIKFGYCTEFIIVSKKTFTDSDELNMKNYLNSIGDSIVCVVDDNLVKIHVHTNDPGLAMQKGLSYGELTSMKIDNLREEHREVLFKKAAAKWMAGDGVNEATEGLADGVSDSAQMNNEAESSDSIQTDWSESTIGTSQNGVGNAGSGDESTGADQMNGSKMVLSELKEIGIVAVSSGEGLSDIFTELGVDKIITGGQTMNPSTDDIVKAIDAVNAKAVFVLPNNGNIILAANQASYIVEDKEIIVLPTKSVPQGISALLGFDPSVGTQENREAMEEMISAVKTGEVTYAVRTTRMDGKKIKKNDFMGIVDGKLSSVAKKLDEAVTSMVDSMVDDESSVISLYYGADTSEADANALKDSIAERYDECDVELHYGGQAVYYYIVSVE